MPVYEYECKECGKVTEQLTTNLERKRIKCPACGSTAKRIMSLNTFRLKGDGWYNKGKTDENK